MLKPDRPWGIFRRHSLMLDLSARRSRSTSGRRGNNSLRIDPTVRLRKKPGNKLWNNRRNHRIKQKPHELAKLGHFRIYRYARPFHPAGHEPGTWTDAD